MLAESRAEAWIFHPTWGAAAISRVTALAGSSSAGHLDTLISVIHTCTRHSSCFFSRHCIVGDKDASYSKRNVEFFWHLCRQAKDFPRNNHGNVQPGLFHQVTWKKGHGGGLHFITRNKQLARATQLSFSMSAWASVYPACLPRPFRCGCRWLGLEDGWWQQILVLTLVINDCSFFSRINFNPGHK